MKRIKHIFMASMIAVFSLTSFTVYAQDTTRPHKRQELQTRSEIHSTSGKKAKRSRGQAREVSQGEAAKKGARGKQQGNRKSQSGNNHSTRTGGRGQR